MAKPKNPKIIELLNDVLTAELTAINQYFMHAELCAHWGYKTLYQVVRAQSIDEMKHAEKLVERILMLDGIPNLQRLGKIKVGESVPEQFDLDLALENEALERLAAGIALCQAEGDHGSRLLLEEILKSEEEHVEWLDTQINLLKQVGVERYLAEKIG